MRGNYCGVAMSELLQRRWNLTDVLARLPATAARENTDWLDSGMSAI